MVLIHAWRILEAATPHLKEVIEAPSPKNFATPTSAARPDRFDLKRQFTAVIRGTGSASSTSATPSPTQDPRTLGFMLYALRNRLHMVIKSGCQESFRRLTMNADVRSVCGSLLILLIKYVRYDSSRYTLACY